MQFDLKNFLKRGTKPYSVSDSVDFSKWDFPGYRVLQPVSRSFTAQSVAAGVQMELSLKAIVEAECARCLAPVEQTFAFSRDYLVKPQDMSDPDFELPLDEKDCLDVDELAYQELIFEVPGVLLCNPDCLGLCPICGKSKAAGCSCQQADDAAPVDARLSILKQLLS